MWRIDYCLIFLYVCFILICFILNSDLWATSSSAQGSFGLAICEANILSSILSSHWLTYGMFSKHLKNALGFLSHTLHSITSRCYIQFLTSCLRVSLSKNFPFITFVSLKATLPVWAIKEATLLLQMRKARLVLPVLVNFAKLTRLVSKAKVACGVILQEFIVVFI